MATLKGQNLRIGTLEGNIFKCFAMATSCSITRGTQTEDANTKDDVGMASKPTVTSKSTQIQVESLDILDMAQMLTLIKLMQPMTLIWDETGTTDNQTPQKANFARKCSAYMSDGTFTFNNRENASKSLQFTASGPVEKVTGNITTMPVSDAAYTKGQFVRLFISDVASPANVIGAALQLSLHISVSLESAQTKDTDGDYDVQEPTGISYDITTNALVRSGDTITSTVGAQDFATLQDHYESEDVMYWQICNVSGANQRSKGIIIASGRCIISQLQLNAPNRQNADYTATLQGYGEYTVLS